MVLKNLWIYEKPREVQFEDSSILMMPWINTTNYSSCIDAMKKSSSQIMMGHFEISGFEMQRACGVMEEWIQKYLTNLTW